MKIVLFLTLAVLQTAWAGTGTVTLDYSQTTGFGTPMVFGLCKYPLKAQDDDIYPKLVDAGITYVKADFYFEVIVPPEKCASVEAYKNNVNDIQNPYTWNFNHLYWIDDARHHGLKIFMSATYVPPWLSWSGTFKGVPKDWDVWEDIVRKVLARYRYRVDWIDIWNEIEYWHDLDGSPYNNQEDFLVDYFYHTVRAIRAAGVTVPTGGFAFAYDEPDMFHNVLQKMVAKYGRDWVDRNFNFFSVHHYGNDPGHINRDQIRAAFIDAGLNPNRPIFVDEWNYTTDCCREDGELYNARAIGYVGQTLADFIKCGVNAAYYSAYPRHYVLEGGDTTTLAFYTVNTNQTTGTLLPQSSPYKILSHRLGLGQGRFVVKSVSDQTTIDACAAINSDGEKVGFIVNYRDQSNRIKITLKGLTGSRVAITDYYGNTWDPVCPLYKTITKAVNTNGVAIFSVNLQPNTCVGFTLAPTN
jgi:hypothetical protein